MKYLTLAFCLLRRCNLHLNVFESKYISSRGVNLANSSNMLHKRAYKDSLFPLTAQTLIPTASITTADCLLLYSVSVAVQVLVSQCSCGESKSLSCSTWILAQFWSSYERGANAWDFLRTSRGGFWGGQIPPPWTPPIDCLNWLDGSLGLCFSLVSRVERGRGREGDSLPRSHASFVVDG